MWQARALARPVKFEFMSTRERPAPQEVSLPETHVRSAPGGTPEDEQQRAADGERVKRALQGDGRAFEEIYTEYRPAVFKVAYGVTGNVEDALDVTQETFLKAHRSLELFEGRASVLTWLCQIAIHRAIDLGRRKKVRRAVELEDYMTPARMGR